MKTFVVGDIHGAYKALLNALSDQVLIMRKTG